MELADAKDEEVLECAICFESIPTLQVAELPCSCKLTYCRTCWDRALAASISASGETRCPSCRAGLHVDLEADTACLRFQLKSEDQAPQFSRADHERLMLQARPLQIQLLSQHGATLSDGESMIQSPPPCVCGSHFRQVSMVERVRMMFEEMGENLPEGIGSWDALGLEILAGGIQCDLCDGFMAPGGSVWTCENRSNTMMHSASYDVCEECFAAHVHGIRAQASAPDFQVLLQRSQQPEFIQPITNSIEQQPNLANEALTVQEPEVTYAVGSAVQVTDIRGLSKFGYVACKASDGTYHIFYDEQKVTEIGVQAHRITACQAVANEVGEIRRGRDANLFGSQPPFAHAYNSIGNVTGVIRVAPQRISLTAQPLNVSSHRAAFSALTYHRPQYTDLPDTTN